MRFAPEQVGVQLYTLRDQFTSYNDVVHTLQKVCDIGYKSVQFFRIPIEIRDMRDILQEMDLSVCGVDVPLARLEGEFDQVLKEMELLNCRYITYSYGGDWSKSYLSGLEAYIKSISEIGERLKSTPFKFAYHNHSFEFVACKGRPALDYFYEQTAQAGILAEIDTYWVQHGGGDPAEWISRYKGRVPIIHLKDLAIEQREGKVNQVFAEVGRGNMNWDSILRAAAQSEVEWLVVEQDVCTQDPFESVKESFDYIVSAISRLGLGADVKEKSDL
ncbi:sugar phosphate isomerase/epimerase family protein [Paenibacillus thalictri]|uniref:Sugar phosphate isomerase/epimerase n=1 Tax=Paenibacillus thalictri TaxID=2527873 RepID=A0A4Q9DKI4_9BACL|nr:sugar phosphate isomerase/epimerase [Paenibacillus thalictri]TBL75248.1 sugar phosphate isomerase/epimerase [Paenibacillus thalictri]